MARAVVYRLEFDTYRGRPIEYQLDFIVDTDNVTIPGYSGTPLPLIGTADPIHIEWTRRDDPFEPVLGSSMKINLIATEDVNYVDFNSLGERQVEVRLRREGPVDETEFFEGDGSQVIFTLSDAPEERLSVRVDGTELTEGTDYTQVDRRIQFTTAPADGAEIVISFRHTGISDVWCGFILPSDFSESVTTFPFNVSIEATDRLGLLNTQVYPVGSSTPIDNGEEILLFSVVTDALTQTALNLPIYVDSGIDTHGGDALTTARTTQYSFSDEEERERTDLKEALEEILATFNCKVFQSNGAWYIINASTHQDVATLQKWDIDLTATNPAYEYVGDVSLSTVYNIGNASDLHVLDQDLAFFPRLGAGSVQADVKDLTPVNYVNNGHFNDITPLGWEAPVGGDALEFNTGVSLTGRSIVSDRNVNNLLNAEWFRNSTGVRVDYGYPVKLEFDHLWDRRSSSVAEMEWRAVVFVSLPSAITGARLVGNSLGFLAPLFGQSPIEREEFSTTLLQWSPLNDRWTPVSTLSYGDDWVLSETDSDAGNWKNSSFTLSQLRTRVGIFHGYSEIPEGGTIHVRFLHARTIGSNGDNRGGATNEVITYIDNVQLRNEYTNDEDSPVFERVQSVNTDTVNYEPAFVTHPDVSNGFYQKIDSTYWLPGESASTDARSLEEVVTQLKLNDYRDILRFYEGNFIIDNVRPIQPINKILVNYNANGVTYQESAAGIINSGVWNVKGNSFDCSFHIPQQEDNVTSDFFTEDVQLVGAPYIPTAPSSIYTLRFDTIGLDDTGNPIQTTDGNGVEPDGTGYIENFTSIRPDSGFINFTGFPGQQINHKLVISPTNGFEVNASNLSVTDTDSIPAPRNVEVMAIQQEGTSVIADLVITIPEDPEFEILDIRGEVDPFIADNRNYNITFALTSGTTGGAISSTSRTLRGIPGTVGFTEVLISPTAGREFDATSFSVDGTLPTGVTLLGFSQLGTSVIGEFSVEFQNTAQTATITLDGDPSDAIAGGVDTSTVTITFTEAIANVSISRTGLTLTGIVGGTYTYDLLCYAADGWVLDSDNFSVTETAAWISQADAVGGGESVAIPITIQFPAANSSATVTVNGSAQAFGVPVVDLEVSFTNNVTNSTLVETNETFSLNPGQTLQYVNTLVPNDGYELSTDIAITESADTSNIGSFSIGQNSKFQANIVGTITAPNTDASATYTIGGTSFEEPYQCILNISEELPQGRLATSTLTQRFGATDISNGTLSFEDVHIVPNEGRTAYSDGTTFTIVGATASNYTYNSDGSVTFDLTVSLPTFSSSNPEGDISLNVSVTGIAPAIQVATRSEQAPRFIQVNANGHRVPITVTANGTWRLDDADAGEFFTIANFNNEDDRGGNMTIVIPANTSGASRNATRRILAGDASSGVNTVIGGVTVQQSAMSGVESNSITSINVNIGGTAGSATGVLYIT